MWSEKRKKAADDEKLLEGFFVFSEKTFVVFWLNLVLSESLWWKSGENLRETLNKKSIWLWKFIAVELQARWEEKCFSSKAYRKKLTKLAIPLNECFDVFNLISPNFPFDIINFSPKIPFDFPIQSETSMMDSVNFPAGENWISIELKPHKNVFHMENVSRKVWVREFYKFFELKIHKEGIFLEIFEVFAATFFTWHKTFFQSVSVCTSSFRSM